MKSSNYKRKISGETLEYSVVVKDFLDMISEAEAIIKNKQIGYIKLVHGQ